MPPDGWTHGLTQYIWPRKAGQQVLCSKDGLGIREVSVESDLASIQKQSVVSFKSIKPSASSSIPLSQIPCPKQTCSK